MRHVADALVDVVLDGVRDERTGRVRRIFDWVAKMTKPPVGVRLVCDDGGRFTGFVLVDENQPIAMLALRVSSSSRVPVPEQHLRPMFDEPL